MKDNTYIIPAINFYILKEPKGLRVPSTNATIKYQFNEQINKQNYCLVPFEEVDGLTVSEMKSSLGIENYFAIVAVNEVHKQVIVGGNKYIRNGFSFFDMATFSLTADILNIEISKLFERYIQNSYSNLNDSQKRLYCAFLEKYRYQDYGKTKQKIKEIEENRK